MVTCPSEERSKALSAARRHCVEEARRHTDASSIGAEPGWQASHFPEPLTIVAADKHDPMSVCCVWQ